MSARRLTGRTPSVSSACCCWEWASAAGLARRNHEAPQGNTRRLTCAHKTPVRRARMGDKPASEPALYLPPSLQATAPLTIRPKRHCTAAVEPYRAERGGGTGRHDPGKQQEAITFDSISLRAVDRGYESAQQGGTASSVRKTGPHLRFRGNPPDNHRSRF